MVAQADEAGPVVAGKHRVGALGWLSSGRGTADIVYMMSSAGVLLAALVVNFFRLGPPVVMPDEVTYATAAWRYIQGTVGSPLSISSGGATGPALTVGQSSSQINADNFQHPPLGKLLFGLAQLTAGHQSVTADRTVAAIATIL